MCDNTLSAAPGTATLPGTHRPALPDIASAAILVAPREGQDWCWPEGLTQWLLAARRRHARIRILIPQEAPHPAAVRLARDLGAAGAEVRTTRAPQPLLVVDAEAAVVPQPAAEPSVTTVRQPAVVRLLHAVVELLWDDGAPVREERADGSAETSRQLQRRIVQLLALGAKDETVARTLGLSVRTCRRHIAEILTNLGAVSRFQAGVNAVRLGLLGSGGPESGVS